jgi:hypothetical protein
MVVAPGFSATVVDPATGRRCTIEPSVGTGAGGHRLPSESKRNFRVPKDKEAAIAKNQNSRAIWVPTPPARVVRWRAPPPDVDEPFWHERPRPKTGRGRFLRSESAQTVNQQPATPNLPKPQPTSAPLTGCKIITCPWQDANGR